MKNNIIFSITVFISGLLIALGPLLIFKACPAGCCSSYPDCLWTTKAELGMGMVIAALGLFFIVYNDAKVQLGMCIGLILTSLVALLIPHVIFVGCAINTMECHLVTFPVLTVISVFLLAYTGIRILSLAKNKS